MEGVIAGVLVSQDSNYFKNVYPLLPVFFVLYINICYTQERNSYTSTVFLVILVMFVGISFMASPLPWTSIDTNEMMTGFLCPSYVYARV